MTAMLIHSMAPIMFTSLVVFLLLGYPVAFSLAANGLIFGLLGIELGLFRPDFLQALPERIYGIMNNDILLAIPFFTFMGLILERSGMAEDLLDTIGQLFGTVRGGVAYAVVFVGALLAATTGVVAASVISLGLISLPIMLRYGYDRRLASGVIAASGTLAQIIPPSLVLIVLADQLGRSVGDMYAGAIVPGLVLTALYATYVLGVSLFYPKAVPALPPAARLLRGWKLVARVLFVLIPPLALIFLVLGTIFLGIATPTEGGAMGATGALALALINRRLSWVLLKQAMNSTAKLTSFVVFILVGATVFSLPFGFALFYLRSVAPAREYLDKISGKSTPPVTTGQIYWGAVPFVVIQVIMVGVVIVFPGLVTGNVEKLKFDPSKVQIIVPTPEYEREELNREGAAPDASPGTESSDDLQKQFSK